MAERNLIIKGFDWFIPDESFEDRDLVLRSRLMIAISLLTTALWLPVVFSVGPLGSVLGIVSGAFLLFLPFFFKKTGSLAWAGHGIVLVITLSNFYRAYWVGGYDAVILWWNVVAPVIAVLLIGSKSGFIWLLLNSLGVGIFYYMETAGVRIPGVGAINDNVMLMNAIFLAIVLTTTSFYLERSKNLVMEIRKGEVEKTRALAESMQKIADEIKLNTRTIHSSSDDLAKTLNMMKGSAKEIEQVTLESSSAVNQGTNTIQELSSSLGETLKRMKELEHSSMMTETRGTQATDTIKQSIKAMARINESRQEYDTILQAITDIADSAHLLSLNAAIEAAKAGEYGKGFFVVVEEIRDLAQRSNDAVIDIRKVTKKSGFVLSRSKNVMVSVEEVFYTVIQLVESITHLIRELTAALEEQNIGIKEIAKGTEDIAHSTEENLTLIQTLKSSLEDNTNTVENLRQIALQLDQQQTGVGR